MSEMYEHILFSRTSRYLIAGAAVASVQLGLFYLLSAMLGIWYLASSTASAAVALITSFMLQKLWTFENRDLAGVHGQAAKFLILYGVNLGVNALLMYVFVDGLRLPPVPAQISAMAIIAGYGFFIYKHLIFK